MTFTFTRSNGAEPHLCGCVYYIIPKIDNVSLPFSSEMKIIRQMGEPAWGGDAAALSITNIYLISSSGDQCGLYFHF